MNIMTTIGNFLKYSARSPENNPNININQEANKRVLAYNEPWMLESRLSNFCTIVFDVLYFVGNTLRWNEVQEKFKSSSS